MRKATCAGCVIIFIGLAACTNTSKSSSPTSTSLVSANGEEVLDSGCDKGAFDAATPTREHVGTAHGTLQLKRSGAGGACKDIFWGRFVPDSDSQGSFAVTIEADQLNNKPTVYRQLSEPNPVIVAYTRGAQGFVGHKVKACVIGADQTPNCVEITVV